jgi:hypothetical protein
MSFAAVRALAPALTGLVCESCNRGLASKVGLVNFFVHPLWVAPFKIKIIGKRPLPFLYILNPTRSGAVGAACGSIFFDLNKFSDMALRLCIIAALVAFAFGACPFAKLNGPCPHASLLSAQADVQLSAEWGGSDPKPDVGQVLPLPLCLRPPLPPPRRAARKAAFRSMPNCRKP